MVAELQYLDFCRVKKIFDKGFGFLTSIYYDDTVFFHFSKIRDQEIKEKLNGLKRGVVYLFYTSTSSKGKRKVDKIWFDVNKIEPKLIPAFTFKIVDSFNGSKTNLYELAHVVMLLKESGYFNRSHFEKLLNTSSIKKIPSLISSLLSEAEKVKINDLDILIEEADVSTAGYSKLCSRLIEELY